MARSRSRRITSPTRSRHPHGAVNTWTRDPVNKVVSTEGLAWFEGPGRQSRRLIAVGDADQPALRVIGRRAHDPLRSGDLKNRHRGLPSGPTNQDATTATSE